MSGWRSLACPSEKEILALGPDNHPSRPSIYSNWRFRWHLRISEAAWVSLMDLPLPFLGGSNTYPLLVSESVLLTRIVPVSRSTSAHLNHPPPGSSFELVALRCRLSPFSLWSRSGLWHGIGGAAHRESRHGFYVVAAVLKAGEGELTVRSSSESFAACSSS